MESVVAATLLGIVGIGALKAIEGITRSSKVAGAAAEINSAKLQIQGLLSDSAACLVAMQDGSGNRAKFNPDVGLPQNPTSAQISAYNQANSLAQIRIGSLILAKAGEKTGNFFVSSVRLNELDSSLRANNTTNSITSRKFIASLDFSLVLGNSANDSAFVRQIRLPIVVSANNAGGSSQNEIVSCSLTGAGGTSSGNTFSVSPEKFTTATNGGQTTKVELGTIVEWKACFLTLHDPLATGGNANVRCAIESDATNWYIRAYAGANDSVRCGGRCLK